jgi:hypothetical protein
MKYLRAEGLLVASLLVVCMVGSSSAFAKCTAPRVEQVDFKNNEAVLVDHTKNSEHGELEAAKKITSVDGADEVEWKSPKAGEVKKNWPLAYVTETKMVVEARLGVEAENQKCLEKELEAGSKLQVTGETSAGGVNITFKKELSVEEMKTQFTAHKEYLTTGPVVASNALPNKVFYESITIKWIFTAKEKGGVTLEGKTESTHNLYVALARVLSGTEIYLTLLERDTRNIEKEAQPPNETKAISGTWKAFANPSGEIPTMGIVAYNPENGTYVNRSGTVLWYYGETTPNTTLAAFFVNPDDSCPASPFTASLLENLRGRCETWARAFKDALATEGVGSERVLIRIKYAGPCEFRCWILVKNWTFGLGNGEEFPYTTSEVTRANGVAGQGIKNPPAFFNLHFIVKAGPSGSALLYDPSYGTGPFHGTEGLSGGEKPTVGSVLKEYQKKSVAGSCRFTPGALKEFEELTKKEQEEIEKEEKEFKLALMCQKAPETRQLIGEGEAGEFTFP